MFSVLRMGAGRHVWSLPHPIMRIGNCSAMKRRPTTKVSLAIICRFLFQQRLTGLPEFRLHVINNAYAEGWAVYAEALGKEIGYFQDPAWIIGRLNLELMRAVRLVVDAGIHSEGWTREQAVAYFRDSGAGDEPTIQAEIDRYIAWPAQALSYQIGKLTFLDLRSRAEQRLGSRFDLRAFHDEILSGGSLPLDMLEARVDHWVGSQH